MKLTINESANINMNNNLLVYWLKSEYSNDDIMIYGNDRKSIIDAGEKIRGLIYDATDLDYRLDDESDILAEQILEIADKYGCAIAAEWPRKYGVADFWVSDGTITITDTDALDYEAELVRRAQGNFKIWG